MGRHSEFFYYESKFKIIFVGGAGGRGRGSGGGGGLE